jgi:dihydroxyacetone kinase-like predicted kinase
VPGEGLAEVFRSLGVAAVVPGGQSMNPSAHEILEAARRTRAQTVIVLPNNANVLSTAEHAARLVGDAGPRLRVVPTTTVPQGIAAQLAVDPQRTPEPNVAAMAAAAGRVRTVEITRATRAVVLDGVAVRRGDVLALLDGMLAAAAGDPLTAAQQALERAGADTAEVLTVYRGQAVAPQHAAAFVAGLRAAHPAAEIECVAGGQPHYDYIISVE